jgi:hypothetical protein
LAAGPVEFDAERSDRFGDVEVDDREGVGPLEDEESADDAERQCVVDAADFDTADGNKTADQNRGRVERSEFFLEIQDRVIPDQETQTKPGVEVNRESVVRINSFGGFDEGRVDEFEILKGNRIGALDRDITTHKAVIGGSRGRLEIEGKAVVRGRENGDRLEREIMDTDIGEVDR